MSTSRTSTTSENPEPGVPPAGEFIALCVPEVRGNEWQYVRECFDTNWVSSAGPFVDRFERDFAECVGTRHAIATASGTAAIHVALLVAGVEPDDEVIVSTLTFIAPANAIRYVGAFPTFVDAEPDYWQMDAGKLVDFLDTECQFTDGELRNKATGRRIKAIMPVHILGHPVDMDPIIEVAGRYGLAVISDATESLGAEYRGRKLGQLADIACFSFNGNKIITTGSGGMIVTDREDWAERAKYLTTQAKDDPVEYVHEAVGYNYRLTNIQAAMGCAQLEQLSDYVAAKRRIAAEYAEAFRDVPGISPMAQADWALSTCWMFTVMVDPDEYGMDSRELLRRLAEVKIQARPLWQPMHRSPAHAGSYAVSGGVAERINRDALSLPCSVGLSKADQKRVIDAIRGWASR